MADYSPVSLEDLLEEVRARGSLTVARIDLAPYFPREDLDAQLYRWAAENGLSFDPVPGTAAEKLRIRVASTGAPGAE